MGPTLALTVVGVADNGNVVPVFRCAACDGHFMVKGVRADGTHVAHASSTVRSRAQDKATAAVDPPALHLAAESGDGTHGVDQRETATSVTADSTTSGASAAGTPGSIGNPTGDTPTATLNSGGHVKSANGWPGEGATARLTDVPS